MYLRLLLLFKIRIFKTGLLNIKCPSQGTGSCDLEEVSKAVFQSRVKTLMIEDEKNNTW